MGIDLEEVSNEQHKGQSERIFWATIPGCITAIAGLITAFAGLIAVFYSAGFFNPPATATPVPANTVALISIPQTETFTTIATFPSTETLVPTLSPTETLIPTLTPPPTSTPPPTAVPIVITNIVHIEKCCGIAGMQRSDPLDFTTSVRTVDFLQIEYSQTKGCSDIFFHILLDDVPVRTTEHVGPVSGNYTTGLIDLSPYISQGRHMLTISPEGVVGGCNTAGWLYSWGGGLIVHTNEYT